jgi:hypothetical protein
LTTVIMQEQRREEQQDQLTTQETTLTWELANDRPTIDAAVKSFISLVTARSLTASATDTSTTNILLGIVHNNSNSNVSPEKSNSVSTQQQVLRLARAILSTINAFQFSLQDTVATTMAEKSSLTPEKKQQWIELGMTARLWNGLVQSEQKPSRYLGRRALKVAWPRLDVKSKILSQTSKGGDNNSKNEEEDATMVAIRERQLQWLQQFETLLFQDEPMSPVNAQEEDDDSALLWSPDNGATELAKRRQRRQDAAKERGPSTPS